MSESFLVETKSGAKWKELTLCATLDAAIELGNIEFTLNPECEMARVKGYRAGPHAERARIFARWERGRDEELWREVKR